MEDILALDEEKAARSVVVKEVPPDVTAADIEIHFQRSKNGGGEVESVTLEKQCAVVTFEEQKVSREFLKHQQVVKGYVLLLEHYQQLDCNEPEVFSSVTARLNCEHLQMTSSELSTIMDDIKAKINIEVQYPSSYGVLMTGSFADIYQARKRLQAVVKTTESAHPQSGNPSERSANPFPLSDSEDILGATALDSRSHEAYNFPDKEQEDLTSMYDTDAMFAVYFPRFYEKQLKSIKEKFNLQITWEKQSSKVILTPQPHGTKEDFLAGSEQFVSLYQSVHQNVSLKRLTLHSLSGDERKVLSKICDDFSVVIERAEDRMQYILYGEEQGVSAVLTKLQKRWSNAVCLSTQPTKSDSSSETGDYSDTRKPGNSEKQSKLEATLLGNIKISVYQGDITEEHVDAIVNAANQGLYHVGGVALAIKKRGGHTIDKESRNIMSQRRSPLKVGEAVRTGSGNLSCDHVIHAVGPEWQKEGEKKSKKILKAACLNSLQLAEESEADSIALPAIGSGVFGMPKEVCARVLFDAVETYSNSLKPNQGFVVNDIRFVIIDDATVKIFREEFKRRYGPPVKESNFKGPSVSSGRNSKSGGKTYEEQKEAHMHTGKTKGMKKSDGVGSGTSSNKRREQTGGGHTDPKQKTSNQNAVTGDRKNRATASSTGLNTNQYNSGGAAPAKSKTYSEAAAQTSAVGEEHPLAATSSKNMNENRDDECPICLDTMTNPQVLKCKHKFCKSCIDRALEGKNRCPVCTVPCGQPKGDQPKGGNMKVTIDRRGLPGHEGYGTIIIDYYIPSGFQTAEHPNPGQYHSSTSRRAYLPDSPEGKEVLQLLRRAFEAGLVFTVGTSVTTGLSNQVTWNDIHHKTSVSGGSTSFGYPDPTYLSRVKKELAAKGIQ